MNIAIFVKPSTMNQIFVCGTYFMVYVSMLKTIYRKDDTSKSILILNDHTPDIEKIIPALKENGFFDDCLFVPFRKIERKFKKERGVLGNIINRNKKIIRYVENNSDILTFHDVIKSAEINLFYLFGFPSAYFIVKYGNSNYLRIIEDGTRNYFLRTSTLKVLKRKYILRTFIGDGFDKSIKEIQVQYPEKLDPRIRAKGTRLELKWMQDNLTQQDKARILNVFMKDFKLVLSDTKKLILITQPFSEDGFITEEYKVRMYTKIVDQYASEYDVFIKPHPRELTDYKERIKRNFVEIPRAFPLEMFDLMGDKTFDVGVTIYSSSLKNARFIKNKILLGSEFITELLPGQKLLFNPAIAEPERA